jgi:hypothetical protein
MEEAMPKNSPIGRIDAISTEKVSDFKTTAAALQLVDGIYIGLSAHRYHADEALGSSGIRDLLKGPNLFWHKSRMNPKWTPDKQTEGKIVGTATHRLLLDGADLFNAEYVRGPYGPNDDELSSADKSALTKAAKKKLLEGQELLTQESYDFVVGCKEVLDSDPKLAGCLDNGLSEVSVFWTRPDGVRCKARLDKLKIRGIGDIKTIANERERPLEQACLLDFATYRYDIPAEHYSEGRRQMGALLAAGKVFAGDDCEPIVGPNMFGDIAVMKFLEQCVAYKNFGFQLVFIPKKGAPDAWSTVLSQGNPILVGSTDPLVVGARADIETAIEAYKAAMNQFGRGKRWLPGHDVEELDITDLSYNFGRLPRKAR